MFEQVGAESPQDYGDLVRLMSTIQSLEAREPVRQAIRDQLLAKLTVVVQDPTAIRGGWSGRGGRWPESGH